MKRTNIAITLLSVFLVAAVILLMVLYIGYSKQRNTAAHQEEKIAALDEKRQELMQNLTDVRGKIQEKDKRITALQDAEKVVSELEEELKQRDKKIAGLEKKISELRSDLAQLEQEQADLREKLQKQNEKMAEMTALKETQQSTISDLREKVRTQSDALERRREELKNKTAQLDELRGEVRTESAQLEKMESHLAESADQKAQLKSKLDQLRSTHDHIVSELKEEIEKKEVIIRQMETEFSLTFVDRILFEFGRSRLTTNGRKVLDRFGGRLKELEGCKIRVEGHTDDVPILPEYRYKYPTNWELSASRAAAVVRHLQEEIGLEPEGMEAVGRSFYDPVASNDTPEGRARNRRVELFIAPELD
jgi:chemotaxis protein MotB